MGSAATRRARSGEPAYVFANDGKEASARFAALSTLFDRETIRLLGARGVRRGWSCLEVGGGGGSIARWLAGRVGPRGRVLATDIDPRFLRRARVSNLEVRQHDVVLDALPENAFDLAHTRLVLLHLPRRERALARMIAALKPGGWLVVEEYDSASILPDPKESPGEVLLKTHLAMLRLLEDRGVDRRCGRRLFGRLRAHGLADVGAEARMLMWPRGSPGAAMFRANLEQLEPALIEGRYVTAEQFAADVAVLDDPGFFMPSPILWSAWGRRA